jgi:hypothetical protein
MVEAESRRDPGTEEQRRRSGGGGLREAGRSEGGSLREAQAEAKLPPVLGNLDSRRTERTQRLRSREEAEARRAKLVRQLISLGLFVVLILGTWLWERSSPPDLEVSEYRPNAGSDPFAYSPRDSATVRGGDFTFDASAPERTRDDRVAYRFHLLRTADSDFIVVPTKVVVHAVADDDTTATTTCLLGEPGERPGSGKEEVEISSARTSFQWSCAHAFPAPPSYLDPSELPANRTWDVTFTISYRVVRFLPLGFVPTGWGSEELATSTTVVYRD